MKAHPLPAIHGWRWLADGYALYRRNPAALLLLVTFYWLVLILLNLIPLLGPVAASIAIPGLAVGIMNACRDLDGGRVPPPSRLFSGFRDNRQTLINLGIVYLALSMLIVTLASVVDGGALIRALPSGKWPEAESGESELAALILFGGLVPLLAAYWFGPMLAAWHRLPAGKALFFSLVACWLNWRPFLVYGLALLLVGAVLPMMVMIVAALVLPKAALSAVVMLLSLPLLLVLMPVVFASFYVSYREVFRVSKHA